MYTLLSQNGLCVVPSYNLISNIGFGFDATHTKARLSPRANLPTFPILPLVHPPFMVPDPDAEWLIQRQQGIWPAIANAWRYVLGLRKQ
jgi:hypothetical protein